MEMILKSPYRSFGRIFVSAGLGLCGCSLAAAPWVQPGDLRARHEIQRLADSGELDRSVTTWPMMWANVDGSRVNTAYLAFEQKQQASPGFKGELSLGGTSDPIFVRGFDSTMREKGRIALEAEWIDQSWAAGLQATAVAEPEDDQTVRADGSYVAGIAGNWVVGVGLIDRWWGPGWQSSLILSTNARPIPAVWLNRLNAAAPESSLLSWIGSWQLTAFAGQLEEERAVPDAKIIGARLTVRPLDGLDVGLSRAIMFGGEGRPEDASTVWSALIGRDNGQEGKGNDPGNQVGSIDIRYGFALGEQTAGLYTQVMGEDEAGAFPAKKSWLLGIDWTSRFAMQDQQWFVEYANTYADDILGDALPNITYDHSIYQSGYRYNGRSMGASVDGDAETISVGGYNFFSDGDNFGLTLTHLALNKDGANRTVIPSSDILYYIPRGEQSLMMANIHYQTTFLSGWLTMHAQACSEAIELVAGEKDQFSIGAEWRYRL